MRTDQVLDKRDHRTSRGTFLKFHAAKNPTGPRIQDKRCRMAAGILDGPP